MTITNGRGSSKFPLLLMPWPVTLAASHEHPHPRLSRPVAVAPDRPDRRRRTHRPADQAIHQEGFEGPRAEARDEHDRPDHARGRGLPREGPPALLQGGA